MNFVQKIRRRTSLLTALTLAVVVFSIPLTLIVLQGEQDIRQEAEEAEIQQLRLGTFGPDDIVPQAWVDMPENARVPGRILVKFKPSILSNTPQRTAAERELRGQFDGDITYNSFLQLHVLEVKPGTENIVIKEIQKNPSVNYVYQSIHTYLASTPNDPEFDKQWGFSKVELPSAWSQNQGKSDTIIAIIDTGIQEDHPDLKGKVVKSTNTVDVANGNETSQDKNGHGTHVAGIASAATDNGTGVAGGCPDCRLMNVKVMPDSASGGLDTDLAEGIKYAVNNGAKVINISIAFPEPSHAIEDEIKNAVAKGILIVAGAGNTGDTSMFYPAAYDDVIAVAATDKNDRRASFSTYGKWVDVAAPGDGILSTTPTYSFVKENEGVKKNYGFLKGTSMASPLVAGLAGVLISEGMSASQAKNAILNSAVKINGTGEQWIHGRINAAKALGAPTTKPDEQEDSDNENPDDEEPSDGETPDPCITPGNNSGRNPRNPGTQQPPSTRTPGGGNRVPGNNKMLDEVGKNAKGGNRGGESLFDRVMRNFRELQNRFFGGGTGGNKNKNNQSSGTDGKSRQSAKDGKVSRVQSVVVSNEEDPCDPENTTERTRRNNNERNTDEQPTDRETRRSTRDGGSRRNARSVYPPSTGRTDQTPGNERSYEEGSGEQVIVTRTERTCEPATVRTPGGVTTIPCDDAGTSSVLSITEYNGIIACFSDTIPAKSCSEEEKRKADLNNDGQVNQVDYNLFLKAFSQGQ